MKIAIVGAGNAGCALAFKLAENGHSISLIKTSNTLHEENFIKIQEQGGIWAIDHTNGEKQSFQKIEKITRDISHGLEGAEVIIVLTQSLQHASIAKLISPYISLSVKMLLVIPGNLGSVIFKNKLKNVDLFIAEGESTPFDARIIKPGVVNILFKNVRNKLGFIPSYTGIEGIKLANEILDTYTGTRTNVIESALHNPNLIVHTVGVIMSTARIEFTKGEFWMYREAFTESIWNLVEALDEEKNKVIEKYGGIPSPYLDECKYRNEIDLTKNSLEVFRAYANKGGPKGPSTIHSRYLYEDVPNGLCLLKYLAQKANIHTPICNSLITIASCLVKKDFDAIGKNRFIEIGWENLTLEQILKII